VVFRPLTREDLIGIVDLEVNKLGVRVQQQGVKLVLDQKAKDFLIEKGYSPDFGARPLRRAVGQYLEDPLSEMLLSSQIQNGQTVSVTRKADAEGKDEDHLFIEASGDAIVPGAKPESGSTTPPPPATAASGTAST
jgi:ATP-dependent Clp protease ATP-binding subunit ClpC